MADPKPGPPDLDLIRQVQRARRLHDAQARPSQTAGVYWIEARPEAPAPPTQRAGRFVLATSAAAADALWARVKTATEAGLLGYKAKVSTAPGPGQAGPDARLIYICTRDSQDAADVARVRAALRALGLPDDLPYETD